MTSNLYPQYKKMQTLAREQLLTLPVGLPIKVKPIVNYILNFILIKIMQNWKVLN